MKVCCRCHQPKDSFPKNQRQPDGLNAECDECTSIKSKEVRIRRKWKVLYHYSNGQMQCLCCSESRFEFLTIDHIHGGGNAHKRQVGDIYVWVIKNQFPTGFRILCCNCNFSFGMYGYCPHMQPGIVEAPPMRRYDVGSIGLETAKKVKELLTVMSASSVARTLDIARQTVQNIKLGRTWKEV